LPHERDVRPANAWTSVLGDDDQPGSGRQQRKQSFEELLEGGRERRLRNIRARSTKLPNSLCVSLQENRDAHCNLLTRVSLGVINMLENTQHVFFRIAIVAELRR
jgi:hypothetical protein